MKVGFLLIGLTWVAAGVLAFSTYQIGRKAERAALREWMQSQGAVGAPGNPLGLGQTNWVRIEK